MVEPTLAVLAKFPRLRAVIDPIAKPDIARGQRQPWSGLLERVSEHRSVCCKLSGMITEADHDGWTALDLAPFITHAVRCFGAARSMFGSDYPVCTLAGSYERVVQALDENLGRLTLAPSELEAIFGGTACDFYRLPRSMFAATA